MPIYKLTQIIHNLFSSLEKGHFISQISHLHKIFLLTAFEQGYLGKSEMLQAIHRDKQINMLCCAER